MAQNGQMVRIVSIRRGRNMNERLRGMGIQVDDLVREE